MIISMVYLSMAYFHFFMIDNRCLAGKCFKIWATNIQKIGVLSCLLVCILGGWAEGWVVCKTSILFPLCSNKTSISTPNTQKHKKEALTPAGTPARRSSPAPQPQKPLVRTTISPLSKPPHLAKLSTRQTLKARKHLWNSQQRNKT